ncbi:MAG: EscI/YscI/HrpB family type III secretion system inner rod protein [Puniceicoccales bacterium]|jgi:hypothetical protein|nr:EscI/YscI/HrpB family type III secretion system inner rod protein [Puniceicoccales bacterium]
MAIEPVALGATERIGSTLAQQATNLGASPNVKMFDDGVFPAMVNGNVTLSNAGGLQKGGRRRRRLIEPVQSSTPGEGVLNSIQSVRDKFMEIQHNIENLVAKKDDFSSADLMKMQYDVMQLAYLNELSSKTADKTSQGAQTLFRNQG